MIGKMRWIYLIVVVIEIVLGSLTEIASAQTRRPEVRRREIRFDFNRGQLGEGFVSQPVPVPIEAAEPFLAVGVVWIGDGREGGLVRVSLRALQEGGEWSDWRVVNLDHDSMTMTGEFTGAISLFDRHARFLQYRIDPEPGHKMSLASLRLIFISPGSTPDSMRETITQKSLQAMSAENEQPSIKYPKPPVVTRTEWGCPDGQITTHGALSYTTVTHLIVHHTATGNSAPNDDWAAVVRSIRNVHLCSNGWADIGYNYLIDPNGVIYEGRAGGDNVQGAHFSGVNSGTMGVSMVGTFTDVTPPPKALLSLKKILAWKADQRGIDPNGAGLHVASGLNLKYIAGHRDGPAGTECPGDAFYPLLPVVRTDVKSLRTNRGTVASVSAASFKDSAIARESIVAGFGNEMATSTMVAESVPLPTSLGGTSVIVRDNAQVERLAPLFFVSPAQINFLMPAEVASGNATVIVTDGEGRIAAGGVTIAPIAPALFAANANGRGAAAALVLRVKANGAQIYEPVAVFDQAQNMFVTTPIDLGAQTDQVFLVAYGTGIRGRSALSGISAKIGGTGAEVLFADAVAGFF